MTVFLRLSCIGLGCIFILSLVACTSTYPVRSVGKGNLGIATTFGGPIATKLAVPIPMPNFYLGVRYGFLSDLDGALDINATSFLIGGFLDMETSVYWVPIQPGIRSQKTTPNQGWGLNTGLSLKWMTNFSSGFVFVPAIHLTGGYRYKWINPYVGTRMGLIFQRPGADHSPIQLNTYFGAEFLINRASLIVQFNFHDITHNFYGDQVQWVYLKNDIEEENQRGAFGISLGFSFTFEQPFQKKQVLEKEVPS